MEPYQYKEHMKVYEMSGYTCKETLPSKLYKVQGNPKEVSETVKAIQSGGMDCYDKARYDPDYFDYEKFKVNQQNCQACYDTIAKHYLRAYFDTLAVYSNGFCAECVGPGFQFGALPGMIAYASSKVEYMHCGYANAPKNTLNIGLIFKSLQYDTSLAQDEKDNWVKLNNWVDFNPIVMEGFKAPIFRECREPWW